MILLTGASGFLGSILFNSLTGQGYQVKTLGRRSTDDFKADLGKADFQFEINEVFDTVVHSAGKAHSVPKTAEEKQTFYTINFEATKRLCDILTSSNCIPKSFIFISTVAVYGTDSGDLVAEDHPLNGVTPYAQSKILAEEWLAQWAKDNKVILSILRLPLVAGPNPPGNLGAMVRGIRSGKYASIGKADARKSMVWAEDIASIVPLLSQIGGTYNLTDGYHPSFGELEQRIASSLQKPGPLKIPLALAKGMAFIGNFLGNRSPVNSDKLKKITSTLTFDDSKARNLLTWHPTPVLDKIPDIL